GLPVVHLKGFVVVLTYFGYMFGGLFGFRSKAGTDARSRTPATDAEQRETGTRRRPHLMNCIPFILVIICIVRLKGCIYCIVYNTQVNKCFYSLLMLWWYSFY